MEKIIRSLGEVNVSNDSRTVGGYALLFDVQSRFQGWYETISRSALTQEVIDNSDVFALFNHDPNKVLARSEYGKGSLKLELDDKGLKYTFEAPKTALGDELLEYLSRGDIHQSSFCCGIDFNDETMVKKERRDGVYYYNIIKIPILHDVSPVWEPAFAETEVRKYALSHGENNEEEKEMKEEEIKEEELKEEEITDEEKNELPEEEKSLEEENSEEDDKNKEEDEEETEENEDEEPKEEEKISRKINKDNNNIIMKEQKFSLVKAIRSIANNQELDTISRAVVDAGADEMRKAGLSFGGQIQLPMEKRALTVNSVHDDIIVTDFSDLLMPLRANNVCVNAGCKYYDNLVGDFQVPIMGPQNVGWAGEIEDATDSGATFDHVVLRPHRLTAYLDISKQTLVQDSISVEEAIRTDLVNAINSKLEETILSANAATATKPAGILNGLTIGSVSSYEDICNMEASIESANFNGGVKYVMHPSAKAALRSMIKGTNGTGMVYEANEVDGSPAFVTTNIAEDYLATGDWSSVAIANWGGIDITVDPFSLARSGQVRITINTYFDFALLREGAIAAAAV